MGYVEQPVQKRGISQRFSGKQTKGPEFQSAAQQPKMKISQMKGPIPIEWAWLCQNCLARNLEKATKCIDCGELRAGTVDDIACADDGCNWASCSTGRPFSVFRTAVGYDKRMLLHQQTPSQALKFAGI